MRQKARSQDVSCRELRPFLGRFVSPILDAGLGIFVACTRRWEPFMLGVGPAGGYAARLDSRRQAQLRDLCREMLLAAPFVVSARAWAARGLAY